MTDLATLIAGAEVVETLAVDGEEVTAGPLGGEPLAVAESLTEPLSRSAWVMV